jgi:hypothetical protein
MPITRLCVGCAACSDTMREIVVADFEYEIAPGERPTPVCCVAHELYSGRRFRLMAPLPAAVPWATGADVLFVAFFASAELGCFRVLGWSMPERVLDLYVEFRNLTNGFKIERSLLTALAYFGLDHVGASEKKDLQQAIGSGTWREKFTEEEVLSYCAQDTDATARLLGAMWPRIDLPRALLRGRYMCSVSAMEFNGVPLDTVMLDRVRVGMPDIKDKLIAAIDRQFGVYEDGSFRERRFEAYCDGAGIPWPRLDSGRLDLDDATFGDMAKLFPVIAPLKELRASLSDLRLNSLAVGRDGRNRSLVSPFGARSGRNTPSNAKFIFGPSTWIRGLIKPPEGYAVAYIDWKSQEIGIAAALSGDVNLKAAYRSGDVYLAFGKQCGGLPADATKATHEAERELYKTCVLGVGYGLGAFGLARKLNAPPIIGRDLLTAHKETYPQFWRWSNGAVDKAMLTGKLTATFGWTIHVDNDPNPRSLRNFPAQGNASEMLRLACMLATERGIEVCAPVHDALVICSPLDRIEADVAATRKAMAEASELVAPGFPLGTDVTIVRYPDRYMDSRGEGMWQTVKELLDQARPRRRQSRD